ncbi:hypothetical protein B0H17DRAFT_1133308 [Mycena rosella]|uniref:Uncharacterized protein n=1 Tax=Mycena rosella TaxID=1033263 RepID=A0AAD7DHY3_MYCRO|nr:hypothetical protein B0H17DRAFT_1133308 [Mycena rosella]
MPNERFRVCWKPVRDYGIPSSDSDRSSMQNANNELAEPTFLYADLITMQWFLAVSRCTVNLTELVYFLSDVPALCNMPPPGLQPAQIQAMLAFLCLHPFALDTQCCMLVLMPHRQLVHEGHALTMCYLASAEWYSMWYVLQKFEWSIRMVVKLWRGLLGSNGVIATYLEELLLAAQ